MNEGRTLPTTAGWAWLALLLLDGFGVARGGPAAVPGGASSGGDGDGLFARGAVTEFRLRLGPEAESRLRQRPRQFVPVEVRCNGRLYARVGARLKGSAGGSFRTLDEKPSWTLDFGRFDPMQTLEGVDRVQLNNAVEDPGYLHEAVATELFRDAGIAVPRVAHARVHLGDRALGLYVLKEGFGRSYLRRSFARTDGVLYDNDTGSDVDQPMHRTGRAGADEDANGLVALHRAVSEGPLASRWERSGEVLDLDRFVTYLALETLVGHRDGYGIARNNFRVYLDAETGRALFLPDGMDQLFGREPIPLRPHWSGLVASALMETPEGSAAYRDRVAGLLGTTMEPKALTNRVHRWVSALKPRLTSVEFRTVSIGATDLLERVGVRDRWFRGQREQDMTPLVFVGGRASVQGWRPSDLSPGARLERTNGPEGRPCLLVVAGKGSGASWRATVRLAPGRYRFEARARVEGVIPVASAKSRGAGLRIQGQRRSTEGLVGDADWSWMSCEFEVAGDSAAVELICELVADAGRLWIDAGSLGLVEMGAGAEPERNRDP